MVYVEGYALCSALGKDVQTAVQQLRIGAVGATTLVDGNKYFHLKNHQEHDYYDSMVDVAKTAIGNANLTVDEVANLGLFIGTSSAKLPLNEMLLREGKELLEEVNVSEVAEILTKRLKINGFSTLISTACTSSANALVQAKEMIESGLIEKALVLGVELYNELSIKGFDSFLLLTKDEIRPFDKERNGVILGEGISAVVLGKEKRDFELSSGTIMLDTGSITSPSVEALVKVMKQCIKDANINIKDISLIKAHATATLHNDAVEADAINELFSNLPKILALKPYLGHTMGACGTNELVLLMASLKEGFVPKTLNFSELDPEHLLEPMLKENKTSSGYALLNYFGFGGNNCCLLLKYGEV